MPVGTSGKGPGVSQEGPEVPQEGPEVGTLEGVQELHP